MTQPTSYLAVGIKRALPVMLGYAPIGAAYGLLAQQAGLGVWPTLGLSVFVFAGAAQFMAVSMLSGGMSAAVIVSSAFVVNFRHVLMSASLSPFLSSWRKWQRVALGGMLTDESFFLHSLYFSRGDVNPSSAIALNVSAYLTWAAAGMAGYRLGRLIENPEVWGLDFALPAMFIGLLLPVCQNRPAAVSAVFGAAAAVALHLSGAGNWAAFIGALAGATAGTCAGFKR